MYKILKNIYTDDKIGPRTLTFNLSQPAPTPVVEEPETQTKIAETPKTPAPGPKANVIPEQEPTPADPGKYYIQDLMNTSLAAANRLGINKYLPSDISMPAPALMDPTFYDPSRELAATGEMANMVTQNLSQFAGPQAVSRASQIQSNAVKPVADILGRYNNLNVGVANQSEQGNKAIINDFNLKRALAKSNYYDRLVTANQQMDNSKFKLNKDLMQQATNTITNKAMTQVLNSMYPEYAVDPTVGGEMMYIPSQRTVDASSQQLQPSLDSLRKMYSQNFPNLSQQDIDKELLKRFTGRGSNNRSNSRNDFLRAFMNSRNV